MNQNSLTRFDWLNLCALLVFCIVLNTCIPVAGHIDQLFSAPWVSASGQYDYKDNIYLISIGHYGLKYIVICIAVIHLCILIYLNIKHKQLMLQRICIVILFSMMCSVSYIAVLKSLSTHACPWSMVNTQMGVLHWSQTMQTSLKCFPGGHASGGFSLIILFFAYRYQYPKVALMGLILALVLGCAMSWVQMMRGAHFLSHNLWSLWWSWLIAFAIQKMFFTFFSGFKPNSPLQCS